MGKYSKIAVVLGVRLALLFGLMEPSYAQDHPVTAIDIALDPDATMTQRVQADNARLLKAYPEGFALDETHHPHLTMVQEFVRTADLGRVYAAAAQALARGKVADWKLSALRYYYIPVPPNGIAGVVVARTDDLLRLHRELMEAIAPFVEKTGTADAFMSTDGGRDVQPGLIDYVANFATVSAGEKFNPHVTIGIAPAAYLDKMIAEPFKPFTFSPSGASVYQVGTFGTARKKLHEFSLSP